MFHASEELSAFIAITSLLPYSGALRTASNTLTTNNAFWHCLTLAACYHLAQSSRHALHMVAALAGYRTALVGTSWSISHLVSTNGHRNHSSPLVGAPSSRSVSSFQSAGMFGGQRALTIETLLINGCDQGHEPTESVSIKLWLKFPALAPSRSGNTDKRRPKVDLQQIAYGG